FKRAFLRAINPNVGYAGFFTGPTDAANAEILGASAYNQGKARAISGVRTRGKYKLIVKLVKPSGLFEELAALPDTQPVPQDLPIRHITQVPFGRWKTLPSAGRYYVTRFVSQKQDVLKKNPHYHGLAPGSPDTIVLDDRHRTPREELAALANGKADVV